MNAPPLPVAHGHASAAVRPFRTGARIQLAVIVKATFQMVNARALAPLPPAPIVAADIHSATPPRAGLVAAAETAPYLARTDVLLTGHAYANGRRPAECVPVRLAVGLGSTTLLDKTLHVYGDRRGAGAPRSFVFLPLGYERACGGAADPDNPVGLDAHRGNPPSIVDPRQPARSAGFGPIAASWPARMRRLGNTDPRAAQAPWPTLPEGFDWSYFQAAPADQQIPYLEGHEWIVLEGIHPDIPRIEAWLPAPVAEARLTLSSARAPETLPLVADMLVIDADRLVCSLVWRAVAPLPEPAAIADARITAWVTLPGETATWDDAPAAPSLRPGSAPRSTPTPQSRQRAPEIDLLGSTVIVQPAPAGLSAVLPFKAPATTGPEPHAGPPSAWSDIARPAGVTPPARRAGAALDQTVVVETRELPFMGPAASSSALPFAPTAATPTLPPLSAPALPQEAAFVSTAPFAPTPRVAAWDLSPSISPSRVAEAASHHPPARRPPLLPGERPPSSAPLVSPRKRRPARVADGGLGARFLEAALAASRGRG